jgi:alpha-mannosidase
VEIEVRVLWNEKDRMLKLAFPSTLTQGECRGQVAYGVQSFSNQGEELVAHQWIGLFSRGDDRAFTIANRTTYGFDHSDGELRLSLLRSPAYAGHPVGDIPIVRQDRFTPRMDQGEHLFRFRLNAGPIVERMASIDRESHLLNAGSMALCCYPKKQGKKPESAFVLSNPVIRLAASKMAENDNLLVIRLFETNGNQESTQLSAPMLKQPIRIDLSPFELKTLVIDPATGIAEEADLLI